MEQRLKIIVEKHADGYVAYPLGLKGIVVGQGDTYDEVLDDVQSAIRFHIETFGREVLDGEDEVLEVLVPTPRSSHDVSSGHRGPPLHFSGEEH